MERQVNRRQRSARLALLCALASPAAIDVSVAGSLTPFYRLTISESLSEIMVEADLPSGHRTLQASEGDARLLRDLAGCGGEPVEIRAGRIETGTANGCLRYRYPLTPQSGRRTPPVTPGVRVVTPGEWLWVPELLPGERLHIEVTGDSTGALSVPWQPLGDNRFELRPSPGSATGTAVLGDFVNLTVATQGGHLRVAALDGPDLQLDQEKLREWLSVAANDVAGVGGRFPNPSVQVIVQPVRSRGSSPVPFGYVIRDGGEAVRFYVDPSRAIEDYHQDWTATHEFAHLLLPYVRSREKWVSEGFASYYQNVLLGRRGAYSEEEAWHRLSRSFARAADVQSPPRLDLLHERPFREMRMLVYWSGAALALEADVRLRAMAEGQSLDTVLGQLADCCLPSERTWSASELFQKLDTFTPEPVFVPLYETYMARRGMPDLAALYRTLGIGLAAGGVSLSSEGRLVAVREAIMRPRTEEGDQGG